MMNKRNKYLYLLMGGHMCADINQGAIPAIMTFLVLSDNFSLTSASGLVFASNFLSSLMQPLIGKYADQKARPWLMSLGIFLAGAGLAVIGFLENYWAIIFFTSLSGLGVAIFHPEGGRLASCVAGEAKGHGLSIFAVGGTLGFALGPVLATAGMLTFGLKGTWVLIIPSILMPLLLLLSNKAFMCYSSEAQEVMAQYQGTIEMQDDWRGFATHTLAVLGRSVVSYGLNTFIPIFWVLVLLQSEAVSNSRLSLFSIIGVLANVLGGRLADYFGYQRVIRGFFVVMTPLLFMFAMADGHKTATFLLIMISLCIHGAYTPMVALGQRFLPNQVGLASGVMMGLAGSFGGIMAPVLGWIGDTYNITWVFLILVIITAATTVMTFLVPPLQARQQAKVLSS